MTDSYNHYKAIVINTRHTKDYGRVVEIKCPRCLYHMSLATKNQSWSSTCHCTLEWLLLWPINGEPEVIAQEHKAVQEEFMQKFREARNALIRRYGVRR